MKQELILLFTNEFNGVASIPLKTVEEQWNNNKSVLVKKKILQVFVVPKDSRLFFFTNTGMVYRVHSSVLIDTDWNFGVQDDHCFIDLLSGVEVIASPAEKPKPVSGIKIVAVIAEQDLNRSKVLSLLLTTKNGMSKKLETEHLINISSFGKTVITLKDGDYLKEVKKVREEDELVFVSSDGRAVKYSSLGIRELGRNAMGVKTMNLKTPYLGGISHELAFATTSSEGNQLLIIGDKGFGKRLKLDSLPLLNRGAKKGVVCHKLETAGWILYASCVNENENLIGWTHRNYLKKIEVKNIFLTDKRYSRGEQVLINSKKVYDSLVGLVKYTN